jgi:hypothetical protein
MGSEEQMNKLGSIVAKRYRGTGENVEPELAMVLSACEAPTFTLVGVNGNRFNWRQDFTRPATETEAVRYWKERTETAERVLEKTLKLVSKLQDQNGELADRTPSDDLSGIM